MLFKAKYIYTDVLVNQSIQALIRASTVIYFALVHLVSAIGMKQPAVAATAVL